MGLDLVEMVIRIEAEFEIEIPNETAEKFTTPKIVIDYLQPQFANRPREYLADRIWLIIEDETGIERNNYNEDSRFIEDMGMD